MDGARRSPTVEAMPPRTFACLPLLSLFALLAFPARSDDAPDSFDWKGRVVSVPLTNELLEGGRPLRDLEGLIAEAEKAGTAALVFEIELAGSAALGAQERLLDLLASAPSPVFAWVRSSATGPGALAALGCEGIYVAPQAIIGGAGLDQPASKDGEADANFLRDQSILKARARSLAASKGHRPEVAEAFVDPAVEVRYGERLVSAKGEALTLTSAEALSVIDGKPLLAKGLAGSVEELVEAEGLPGPPLRLGLREFGERATRARLSRAEPTADGAGEATRGDGEALAPPASGPESGDEKGAGADEAKSPPLFRRRDEGSYRGKVVVLKVGEDTLATGKASFEFMERTLKKAELDGAEAVVLDMDTPGGFAWQTEGLVLKGLQNIRIPTYTFVNPRAESAGAIIAIGTDHIYMRPAATIGSALVVTSMGQDLGGAMEDKVTQMIIGTVRNVAELKGHNPDVAEAFVTRNKEVRIDGVVVHEAGSVLNLNTVRATEIVGGRPVLAKGVARDLDDLVDQESLAGELVAAEPLGMEAFAHWVQKLSFLLIVIGLAGAYLELNSPGFGFPGLVSVAAFALFFFGNYLAGNLAGYELAVLLALGLALIAVEIFVFPGTVVAGLAGTVLVLVAIGLAMVDRVDFEWKWSGLPGTDTWTGLLQGSLYTLLLGFVGAIAAVLLGMRFVPQTRLGSRLVLDEALAHGAALPDEEKPETAIVGLLGQAVTDLRPSGKGEFDGRLLDVVSEGEFVPKEASLRIVKHEGSRIVVAREGSAEPK